MSWTTIESRIVGRRCHRQTMTVVVAVVGRLTYDQKHNNRYLPVDRSILINRDLVDCCDLLICFRQPNNRLLVRSPIGCTESIAVHVSGSNPERRIKSHEHLNEFARWMGSLSHQLRFVSAWSVVLYEPMLRFWYLSLWALRLADEGWIAERSLWSGLVRRFVEMVRTGELRAVDDKDRTIWCSDHIERVRVSSGHRRDNNDICGAPSFPVDRSTH